MRHQNQRGRQIPAPLDPSKQVIWFSSIAHETDFTAVLPSGNFLLRFEMRTFTLSRMWSAIDSIVSSGPCRGICSSAILAENSSTKYQLRSSEVVSSARANNGNKCIHNTNENPVVRFSLIIGQIMFLKLHQS